MSAAEILLDYFDSNIEFIPSGSNSCSPDLLITRLRQRWEIKIPRGNSKNTIHHALEDISRQSENVVISLLRTKMLPRAAIGRLKGELKFPNRIRRLILITKQGKAGKSG